MDWTIVKKDKFVPGGTSECGAGALGWGVALFYDKNRIKEGPTTYAEFFDTKKFPGKRTLREGAKMTLEVALLGDGVAKGDVYKVLATEEGQKRAFKKLSEIKSDVVWWKAGPQPLQLVGSGEVQYAVGYVGRTIRANEQSKTNYPILWDTMLWAIDSYAVVRNSSNKTEAMKLIDYMTDEGPLLEYAKQWPVSPATASVANNEDLKKSNTGMIASHSDEGVLIDTDFWLIHGDDLEAKFNAWKAQ
jgi:putative spermidine/putrescine transport system substrate-binding protein